MFPRVWSSLFTVKMAAFGTLVSSSLIILKQNKIWNNLHLKDLHPPVYQVRFLTTTTPKQVIMSRLPQMMSMSIRKASYLSWWWRLIWRVKCFWKVGDLEMSLALKGDTYLVLFQRLPIKPKLGKVTGSMNNLLFFTIK